LEARFSQVEYYGVGKQPKKLGKKLLRRLQEFVSSVDFLQIRKKIIPSTIRSRVLTALHGNAEIQPLAKYLKTGTLPNNILVVAKK